MNARLLENEKRFRRANEALTGRVEHAVGTNEAVPFLCECSDETCLARVELTLAEYRDVRASDRRFLVAPGHAEPYEETVVGDGDGYDVVEKDG